MPIHSLYFRHIPSFFLALTLFLSSNSTFAKKPTVIDVDVAVGGAGLMFPDQVQEDHMFHSAIRLNLKAVITREIIKRHKKRIPKKYRKLALKQKEIRFRPGVLMLIPTMLLISPQENTSIYGANWSLIGLAVGPKIGPMKVSVGLQAEVTVFSLESDRNLSALSSGESNSDMSQQMMAQTVSDSEKGTSMFFARPGLSLGADIEIPFGRRFAVSVGWKSTVYPPQKIGGEVFAIGELDESIWLMNQAYLDLHFRVPYSVKL